MEAKHLQSPNPPSSSSLLRDISNFRTPKHTSKDPSFHSPHPQFFTASRETPRSSSTARRCHRPSIAPTASASRSKVARRLRAFELEQSKSARKAQIDKEKSLRSLAKSLTVWLNFLFENPASCGCDVSKANGEDASKELDARLISGNGKREGCSSSGIGVDTAWRCPKRQRDSAWRGIAKEDSTVLSNTKFLALQSSLEEVCSFDDLKQRMNVYLSLSSCNEIFKVMTQVTKNIDEGRLKMKSHCPIVTDVGLKEKAARILMLYNPNWLRIGLYVIFGGNSLLADGNANSEMEIAFLKMVIEKQFFSHAGLARDYAYNKLVEGLYRPGYFEILGNVILKRFLLLALVLDRAKAQSCLPIKYGIDGLDGGSPPLFILQSKLRSSHQVIHDFLSSDVMHGEGNLLAHLAIIGYKVSYLQSPLNEYDFRVTELFEDLRDGVRLCRAIQLLQHDTSILMKMVVPSDTHKKNVANCGIALQHLKQAGVPLFDEDGSIIVGEDIVCGDKELTLSLLWNIFIHLQLPLLINKPLLLGEISRIRGVIEEQFNHSTLLDMLLKWIQAICESYDLMVDDFASLVDGKAMWCLLDYYFRKELDCSCSLKDLQETSGETSLMSVSEYTDAVHNFILSQKLTKLLGKFPEVTEGALMLSTVSNTLMPQIYANNKTFVFVLLFLEAGLIPSQKSRSSKDLSNYFLILPRIHERRVGVKVLQVSDILEYNGACSSKSVVILLVFLSFQLIVRRNSDQLNFHKLLGFRCQSPVRKRLSLEQCFEHSEAALNREDGHGSNTADGMRNFKFIMAWWQDMALRNRKFDPQPRIPPFRCLSTGRENSEMQIENAAIVIQSHFRHSTKRRNYLGLKTVVSFLQTVIRAWLVVKKKSANDAFCTNRVQEPSFERRKQSEVSARYVSFMLDRHNFVKLKRSAVIIQHATRAWISRRHHGGRVLTQYMTAREVVNAAIDVHNFVIQKSEKASIASEENEANDLQVKAASCIQLAWSNYLVRNSICHQHLAATKIQSFYRGWLIRKSFMSQKQVAIQLQSLFRCLTQLRGFQTYKTSIRSAIVIQSHVRGWIARRSAYRLKCLVVAIQSHCRGWTLRKEILMRKEALIKIQSAFRCMQCCKNFRSQRHAATEIQGFIRGQIARRRLLGASSHFKAVPSGHILTSRGCFLTSELSIFLWSVLKLQRWWRSVLTNMSRMKSAIIIQSHIRGWIARQEAFRERSHIIVIQSHWKGYLARKDSSWQLLDLRSRVKNSAANVDDGMRIINRLVVALSDLLSMRSVSGILHTCATLDMATEHSQKCCEKLVEAGAVDTLVKLIRSVSRSIPDQEVLKHALSTLRNLARYSHLAEVLIDSHVSVETILWELLRNKEEGYFIASELLKKICSNPKGVEAARNLPALVKRLHNLVEDLTRKAGNEKKSARVQARDKVERRLKEAAELLNLIANG